MAALDWGSSSSTASTTILSSFDVFLSFRGKDTRNNFISFLHKALKDKGINVFVDSETQWVGEAIGSTLCKAIEGSKISIPVFSKGYADSKWCLQELALIVQCHRSNGQLIIPIFYDVEPSHVRHQTGSFKEAFCKHEKKFKPDIVKEWRDALETVGKLIGEVLDETKNQAELVELVVKRVLGELISKTHLAICEYPVGINSSVNDLISLLNIDSNDVQFMGICGFGGIGKTTIAKAVYNDLLLTFDKHSFLSDVREQAKQCLGLASLQKRLLKDILKIDIESVDVHKGKNLIEQRLCKEKVLVVLDDVDSKEQVDALAGKHTWFGEGSRVIITARDEHILNVAKVNNVYRPQVLDLEKSLQLFSWHAFQKDQPPEDYMQLSCDMAHYSGGLPLTLKVLGSYLLDISDKEEWESTLQKLKEIPNDEIQTRLKISYDNLKDDYQRTIFLDAACFFIGWEKETVISLWECWNCYPKSTIPSLIKRSLLNFEYDWEGKYTLRMHDQIRDMGREIVRIENPTEPGKRSRLWNYGDILDVLKEQTGTGMMRGMSLPYALSYPNLASEHFQMIPNLRFLHINFGNFVGDFSHLPSALRCFTWWGCNWEIIPTNFSHDRLVYLDLSMSEMKQAWNVGPQDENKCFEKLKVLNIKECYNLFKSPEFSWFPYLERLDLTGCNSLEKLDESIGQLSQLKYLIVRNCKSLKELPDCVGLLEKLEELDASNCRGLEKLPRSMGRMRCLRSINLGGTKISKIPDDFSSLKNLKQLDFCRCHLLKELPELPSSLVELWCNNCFSLVRLPNLSRLKILRKLKLKHCTKLEEIQGLEGTESLEELDASRCYNLTHIRTKKLGQGTLLPGRLLVEDRYYSSTAISKIPDDFSSWKNLKQLKLSRCRNLEELPELPSSLVKLSCDYCYSLVRLPDLSRLKNLRKLKLQDCLKVEEINGLEGTESLEELNALGCYNLTRPRRKKLGQGTLLPDRLPPHGYSLIAAANDIYTNSAGLILCIVFSYDDHHIPNGSIGTLELRISASVYQKEKTIMCLHELEIEGVEFITVRDTIYVHYFKGFDWFGIPLQGKDAIEILDIKVLRTSFTVKFWKLSYENKEPYQQTPDQYSDASPSGNNMGEFELSHFYVASSFPNLALTLQCGQRPRVFRSLDDGSNPGFTCWFPVEVEGSNSVPTEKVVYSKIQDDENVDDASSPSLSLALTLPCPSAVISLDDGSNQQTQVDQLSHVQENGKTPPPSPSPSPSSNNMEEELSHFFVTSPFLAMALTLQCDQRPRLFRSLDDCSNPDFTIWSSVEVEGSNSVPTEKVVYSKILDDENIDDASSPAFSLALTLPCPSAVISLDDGSNQQTQVDQLSHVQENGKTPPPSPSPSHHTEEEDPERNNTMIDLSSCLGFDSVSDVVEKEGEMLRSSKRARLHDNNDEAPGPSLSLTLSTSSEIKSNNGFNLQQLLSQPPNIDDDDEVAGLSLSLALIPYQDF